MSSLLTKTELHQFIYQVSVGFIEEFEFVLGTAVFEFDGTTEDEDFFKVGDNVCFQPIRAEDVPLLSRHQDRTMNS